MKPFPVFVVCRSDQIATAWQARNIFYDGLDFIPVVGVSSFYKVLNDVIDRCSGPVLVIHDDIWLSIDARSHLDALIEDLDANFGNWGLCGNAGVRWDGTISARHVSDPHGGPTPFGGPRPVMSVDGNSMLLNCGMMRRCGLHAIPDLGGFHGYDLVLSFETLRHEMCVLVDPRLYAKHESGGNLKAFREFGASQDLGDYLARHFMDYRFDTINGPVVLGNRESYPFLLADKAPTAHKRLLDCFDAALVAARREKPITLAICVRSQFKRAALLERFMMSASHAIREAEGLVEVEIALITDQPEERAESAIGHYRKRFGNLALRYVQHAITGRRASRVDLAIAAFQLLDADFIWLIDDDDYLLPSGILSVGRSLCRHFPQLLVVDCLRMAEKWALEDAQEILIESVTLGRTNSSECFEVFRGENFVPVCGAIYPRALMQDKLDRVQARTSYYEDYFMLLTALSAPHICVEQVGKLCCGISVRGADNTVTEKDRTIWNISHATVLGEIQADPELAISVAWDAAKRTQVELQTTDLRVVAREALGRIKGGELTFAPVPNIPVEPEGDIQGYVESLEFEKDELVVGGWAADISNGRPVEQIVIALGVQMICVSHTHAKRPDVALAFKMPTSVECGFSLRITSARGWVFDAMPGVYAVAGGRAVKLKCTFDYGRKFQEVIDVAARRFLASFDEGYYLREHDDVRSAVERGIFASGFAHWLAYGIDEERETWFSTGAKPDRAELAAIRRHFGNRSLPSLSVPLGAARQTSGKRSG